MFQVRSTTVRVLTVAALVVAAGCGASVPGTDGAKISNDGDTFKVETDEGSLESTAALPDDFPGDEVPLLDGSITNVVSLDTETDRGYNVTLQLVGDSVQEIAQRGATLLEEAGYQSLGTMDSGELVIGTYENDDWTVGFTVSVSDQDFIGSYSVAAKTAQ